MLSAEFQQKIWDWLKDQGIATIVLIIVCYIFWLRTDQNYEIMIEQLKESQMREDKLQTALIDCYKSQIKETNK